MPGHYILKLNNRCNLNCSFCADSEKIRRLPDPAFDDLMNGLILNRKKFDSLIITGGEPTVYKKLFEIIRYARDTCGYNRICLVTNGLMLSYKGFTDTLVKAGVDSFQVSYFALNENKYTALSRVKDAFRAVNTGINNAIAENKEVRINLVINKLNYADLPDITEHLIKLNVSSITLAFMNPSGESVVEGRSILAVTFTAVMFFIKLSFEKAKKLNFNRLYIENFPLCVAPKYMDKISDLYKPDDNKEYYNSSKVKIAGCKKCVYDAMCAGVWSAYLKQFGDKEFRTDSILKEYGYPNNFVNFAKAEKLNMPLYINNYLPALDFLFNSGKNKGIAILDAGCCIGLFVNLLHKKGYKNTHGIDIQGGSINFGKKLGIKNLMKGDIYNISKKFKFDIIFCIGVINEDEFVIQADGKIMESIDALFKQINAVLKPGGIFYLTASGYLKVYVMLGQSERSDLVLLDNPPAKSYIFIYKKIRNIYSKGYTRLFNKYSFELAGIELGLKEASILYLKKNQIYRYAKEMKNRGYFCEISGFCYATENEITQKINGHKKGGDYSLYISRNKKICQRLKYLDYFHQFKIKDPRGMNSRQIFFEIGDILGYPKCCSEFLLSCHEGGKYEKIFQETNGQYQDETIYKLLALKNSRNVLYPLNNFSISYPNYFNFFVCNYSCHETANITSKLLGYIKYKYPAEYESVVTNLKMPILFFSAYRIIYLIDAFKKNGRVNYSDCFARPELTRALSKEKKDEFNNIVAMLRRGNSFIVYDRDIKIYKDDALIHYIKKKKWYDGIFIEFNGLENDGKA